MEVLLIAAIYLLLFVIGCVLLLRWDREVEDHSTVDNAWKSANEEKRKQSAFWSEQFVEKSKEGDIARMLPLCITMLKVLGDEANGLTRLGLKIDNSLYHLRYRAHALERLTKPLIVGTFLLYFATVPLAVESTLHLIEKFQEKNVPELKVNFPAPPVPR